MIDDDIHRLDERALDHSLSRLEADIWKGVAARAGQREAARRMTTLQGAIMVVALLGSAAAGFNVGRPAGASTSALLASGVELMPSSLLLGERR
jgi:hypothetical protein